jgi:Ca2+-binding EF-hand superfamily protein
MNARAGLFALGAWAALAFAVEHRPARAGDSQKPSPAAAAAGREAVQDVAFLSDTRPIFIRLRLDAGGKAFRAAWLESVKEIHAYLDEDGNGTLTAEEARDSALPSMVRAATGGAAALPTVDYDANRDGKVTVDELADALRPALGPFRVQVGRVAVERTDALFNHLDRDKDGTLTKDELAAAVASLRRFDLDDDELVAPTELEPFSNPMAMQYDDLNNRRGRLAAVPPVLELSGDDPSFRPVRLLLKRYDKGTSQGAAAGDNRLSRGEFAIDGKDFQAADSDADGELDTEELRRYLAKVEPDLELTVKLKGGDKSPAAIEVAGAGSKPLPPGVKVRRHPGGDVEVAIGAVNLEFHADAGEQALESAKQYYANQFRAADANNDKYLEEKELKDHGPFSQAMFKMMDRDKDGKLYMKEVDAFVEKEARAARSQMVLSASDQGRAIFGIMDQNRDRQLGAREIRGAVGRVTSWDRDGDGKVSADEIPHHYQLTIGRGQITGPGMHAGPVYQASYKTPDTPAAGPSWFRRMDRNRDGDVSRREFLGTRAEFDRIDHDHDGLINADEAAKPKG